MPWAAMRAPIRPDDESIDHFSVPLQRCCSGIHRNFYPEGPGQDASSPQTSYYEPLHYYKCGTFRGGHLLADLAEQVKEPTFQAVHFPSRKAARADLSARCSLAASSGSCSLRSRSTLVCRAGLTVAASIPDRSALHQLARLSDACSAIGRGAPSF